MSATTRPRDLVSRLLRIVLPAAAWLVAASPQATEVAGELSEVVVTATLRPMPGIQVAGSARPCTSRASSSWRTCLASSRT